MIFRSNIVFVVVVIVVRTSDTIVFSILLEETAAAISINFSFTVNERRRFWVC